MTGAIARRLVSPLRRLLTSDWQLAAGSASEEPPAEDGAWRSIDAPVTVAAALTAAGLWSMDAPNLRLDAQVWWYRLAFDVDDGLDAPWTLGFDGLATLAEVWLNGQHILSSVNMFRGHEVAVGTLLRAQGNVLLLRFDALDTHLAKRRPRARWRVPMVEHQQLRWFRTTLLGRTPGWSPPAPVIGPWKGVWLERDDRPTVQMLNWAPRVDDAGLGTIEVSVRVTGTDASEVQLHLALGEQRYSLSLVAAHPGTFHGRLELPQVSRWWPHTHGEPVLYQAQLQVGMTDGSTLRHPLGAVGFRQLALDRSDDGFSLRVNGEPVFCRGACWTPLDTLALHTSPDRYRAVIDQVRQAGMNMLRVGGTMVYEDEAFFAACDAAGVLVWQDLMFANMDYPADDPAFLAEVAAEVQEQMLRLQGHPCVAVVCGNSEVEQQAAMWGVARELWAPPLFHEVLPKVVAQVLPGVPWWPSSAHGGAFPFQPSVGTCSYYGVGAYQRAIGDARASGVRFATECLGFANIPPDDTLQRLPSTLPALQVHQAAWKARVPRDLSAGWDFDDVRDHYVERLYGERAEAVRYSDPTRHLALGRAASGEAMGRAFMQWRSAGSRCGGALVWFLRDLWPGAGWGVLDDECRPKAAFHALARVLQPVHLGITDDGLDGLSLHLVNERPEALDADLEFVLYRDGENPVAQWHRPVQLAARSRTRVAATDGLEGFADLNWVYRFGPPAGDVAVATLLQRRSDGQRVELAQVLHRIVDGPLPRRGDLGLSAQARALQDGRMELTLQTRALAWGVHFDSPGWRPDDEYFHLAPAGRRTLHLSPIAPGRRAWRATIAALNGHPASIPLLAE